MPPLIFDERVEKARADYKRRFGKEFSLASIPNAEGLIDEMVATIRGYIERGQPAPDWPADTDPNICQ